MQTLYKRARNGKIQQWSINVDQNTYYTSEGYVDGKITTSQPTICVGKNIGKSNEVSPNEQAIREAESKWKKKLDRGYTIQPHTVDQVSIVDPMLAHKWKDHKHSTVGVIASQPKLDGIRCIGTKSGLFTRQGKRIVAAPHIERAVMQMLEGLEDHITLDGELYNHTLKEDFNTITSIVRKQNVTEQDIERSEQLLQYHVYDINHPTLTFSYRFQSAKMLIEQGGFQCIKLVQTAFIERNTNQDNDMLDTLYQGYLSMGYEGQMIRNSNSKYQSGRSKSLLKRKEFEDAEFEIIDIEEGVGNRSGMMGRIKFDGFDSNARGTHEYYKELWLNKHKYIGKMATVRYQNLTPDGKPRFPVMIAIRNYE